MCRGSTTACSMNTVGSPKAASPSRMQVSTASRRSFGSSTLRMPRPPPPATAFTNSGYGRPPSAAASISWSTSVDGSTEASVGTPAALAAAIARALLPVSVRTSAVGPMKVMPALAHASASAGFSERNP